MVRGCISHCRDRKSCFSVSDPCHNAEVAQSVEHMTENHGVGSSILPLGTTFCSEGGRSSDRPFLPNARGVPKTQHAQSDVGTGQLIVLPSGSLSRDYPR